MSDYEVQHRSGVQAGNLPEDVSNFAKALAGRHGHVIISREKNGLHLNLACPACLTVEGRSELIKRHLAVNADKWCNTGKWEGSTDHLRDSVGLCMKCGTKYKATALLMWATLAERNIKESTVGKVSFADNTRWLVRDHKGRIIPGGPGDGQPGDVVPINQLPQNHVAAQYLLSRGYDLDSLYQQFRCSYCVREWPHDPKVERCYRGAPLGMRDSPQGRIIFFADQEGIQQSWQARVIDYTFEHAGKRYRQFWDGYTNTWKVLEWWNPEASKGKGKYELLPEYKTRWSELSKYRTANGTSRNEIVIGLDAAIAWNALHRPGRMPITLVGEGPLDAGRLRAPGVAQIGKFLSDAQVAILSKHFAAVIQVPDNDEAGKQDLEFSTKRLASKVMTDTWRLPSVNEAGQPAKDIGDFSQVWVDEHRKTWLESY